MTEHPHGALENPEVAHEESDINVRAVIWFVVILTATAISVQIAMWGMFRVFDKIEVKNDPYVTPLAPKPGEAPPEPRLQTTPWQDLKALRATEQEHLHGYGWVDERGGIAHIPIEKAKQMLLQRGLPARAPEPGTTPDPSEGTHVASLGESNSARSIPAGLPDRSTPQVKTPPPSPAPGAAPGATPGGTPAPAPTTPGKPGGGA
jgi:hypothetical protein